MLPGTEALYLVSIRWEQINMEKEYKLSRIIITGFMMIASLIMFINEDISVKIFGTIVFTLVAFLASVIGGRVSRKMIQTGDKLSGLLHKILYYFALLLLLIAVATLLYLIYDNVVDVIPYSSDLGIAAGQAILTVIIALAFLFFVITPYVQTLIVLFIRKLKNN